MSKGNSPCTHVDEFPRESLTRVAHELDRQVNFVAKISAVLAFHPGKRYVEKALQLLIQNRLAEHEIGSRINRRAHAGCAIHDGDDDRCLVGATAAYLDEQIHGSRDTIAVNDEAIEVPPSREFDGACSIGAHFEFDTRRAKSLPKDLQ